MSTEISAIMQIKDGTEFEWSLLSIPIPDGVLAYAIDTMIIKLGNGTDLWDTLPVFFNLSQAGDLQTFKDKFPTLDVADANKILIINGDGTGYMMSTFSVSDLVTLTQLNSALTSKATDDHTHTVSDVSGLGTVASRDVGLSPGNIPEITGSGKLNESVVPIVQEDSLDRDNILTWLVMKQLSDDDSTKLQLLNGIANEFEDTVGIDSSLSTNIAHDATGKFYTVTADGSLVSTNNETDNVVSHVHLFTRVEEDLHPNVNLIAEVSRDDGVSWAHLPLSKSKLSGDVINIYTGDCTFNEQNASVVVGADDYTITDHKGSIMEFVVDTAHMSGHFDSAATSDIEIGMSINLGKYNLVITNITADGTGTDGVEFVGIIPTGIYTLDSITSIIEGYIGFGSQGINTSTETLTIPIKDHTSHFYDDKIYIIGGTTSVGGKTNRCFSYNPATTTVIELASLPVELSNHASVIYDDDLYVIGGQTSSANVDTIYKYDFIGDSWTVFGTLPQLSFNHTATVYGTNLYVIGGENLDYHNTVLSYDFVGDSWTTLTGFSVGISNHTATLYDGKIYVIGGKTSSSILNTIYAYDIVTDTWTQKEDLPIMVYNHASTSLGAFIYVVGGNDDVAFKDTVYRYNIMNDTWDILSALSDVLDSHTVCIDNNIMYIVGGYDDTTISDLVQTYDVQSIVLGIYSTSGTIDYMEYDIDETSLNYIKNIEIKQEEDNTTAITYMLKFGDEYKIFYSGVWYSIIRNNSGTYQYKDDSGVWQDASENTIDTAISEAVNYTINSMSHLTLDEIPTNEYTEIPDKLIVVFKSTIASDAILSSIISATTDYAFPVGNDVRWKIKVLENTNTADVHGVSLNWN